jgi:uncharacterized protein (DUF4415 family)
VILDSDWEGEFCRVAESHPRVRAYVKNHNLGLEVPYRYGSETRKYRPDFIVLVDDGHGPDDLLHLVVEIKGYRREDAKEKKSTMDTYWVPGVNHLGSYGRWAFAEFTEVARMIPDRALLRRRSFQPRPIAGKDASHAEWQAAVRARVGKLRINIMLDAPIVEHFKALAGKRGYQTIINDTLRRVIETGHLEADLRRVIREELARR